MTSGLRHTTHPLQLRAIEVVGPGYLRTTIVDALLALLKIVTVVAAIGIYRLIIEFENHRTYPVEEESVVSNHQECPIATIKIALEPLYHLKIEMVSGLIKD